MQFIVAHPFLASFTFIYLPNYLKTSQCAAHVNWKTPKLPSVLSYAGAVAVKTITTLWKEMKIYLQGLPSFIKPQIWLFHVVVLQNDSKKMD